MTKGQAYLESKRRVNLNGDDGHGQIFVRTRLMA